MFYAFHGLVLSDPIQEIAQYSAIPPITSFLGACWEVSPATITRLCDIVMKNQALYFFG
jgi:hypothetical protein